MGVSSVTHQALVQSWNDFSLIDIPPGWRDVSHSFTLQTLIASCAGPTNWLNSPWVVTEIFLKLLPIPLLVAFIWRYWNALITFIYMDKQHQSISLTFTSVARKDFIKLPLTLTRRFVRTGDNEFVKMSSEDVRWSTQGRWFGCYYSYITTFVGVPKLRRSKNFSDDSACQVSADTWAANDYFGNFWGRQYRYFLTGYRPVIGLLLACYLPCTGLHVTLVLLLYNLLLVSN